MPTEFRQTSKHVNLRQVVVLPTNQAEALTSSAPGVQVDVEWVRLDHRDRLTWDIYGLVTVGDPETTRVPPSRS